MRMKLHNLIFLSMALGIGAGLLLWWVQDRAVSAGRPAPAYVGPTLWTLDLLGPTLFMGALKMIIGPLILASIVTGVTSLPNVRELGAIGRKTILYYVSTTSLAVVVGLAAVLIIQPGHSSGSQRIREAERVRQQELRAQFEQQSGEPAYTPEGEPKPHYVVWLQGQKSAAGGREGDRRYETLVRAEKRTPGDIFREDILAPTLMNPVTALASDPPNALGIIFFSLLLGMACVLVGPAAQPVVAFFHALNGVILRITMWIMRVAPLAIFAIVAKLVADTGPSVFESLGWYCGTVIGGIAIHILLLLTICFVIARVSPRRLWHGAGEALLIAFSTRSSAATLPVTIAGTTRKLGVSPKVANFSLPLGATMNMDGTALYEGVAVIFLIQIYGGLDDVQIAMTPMTTFLIFITAVVASIGAAAVPSAGLVTMVLVASAVGLPIYYIPLIFAVDAALDMFRTTTNVLGDVVGACVVNRLEGNEFTPSTDSG